MKLSDDTIRVLSVSVLLLIVILTSGLTTSCRRKAKTVSVYDVLQESRDVHPQKLGAGLNKKPSEGDRKDDNNGQSSSAEIITVDEEKQKVIFEIEEDANVFPDNIEPSGITESEYDNRSETGDSAQSVYVEQKEKELVQRPYWSETESEGKVIREDFVIPEGVFRDDNSEKEVYIWKDETLKVVPIENEYDFLRTDYMAKERLVSVQVEEYLKGQKVSNAFSHISNPAEIIGNNVVVEGLPFYSVPGYIAGNDISMIEIDYDDYDGDGVLAAVYETCNPARAKTWGLSKQDSERLYTAAVYIDIDHVIGNNVKNIGDSLIKDFFRDKVENHLGIIVTRPAEYSDANSDYFFLAYPLETGKYVIDIAGGLIVLNRIPAESVSIYFDNGGGDLGFYGLEIAVDGKVVYTCDHFKINSTSVVTTQY